jgi:hypothetical protein
MDLHMEQRHVDTFSFDVIESILTAFAVDVFS